MKFEFSGLWRHPDFMKLWFGQTVSEFGSRISRDGLPLVAVISLAATPAQLGLVVACGGIGALLGAWLAGWLRRWMKLGHILTLSLCISAGATMLIPFAGGSPRTAMLLLMVAQIIGDGAMTVFYIHELSLRQAVTPDLLLGRINTTNGFLAQGIAPLGALIAGGLATLTSPRTVLWVATSGILLSAFWVISSPVGTLEHYPPLDSDQK